jgi:UDP-N-acetylmuramoyl-L-alanyl-D-glutamate--2,6-diaminopimelate ligase
MRLQTILQQVDVISISGPLDREVTAVSEDSRVVGAGGLFVAIRGEVVDGHKFTSLVKCEVVVGEQASEVMDGVTFVLVPCSRTALAQIASNLYGDPSSKISVVGLTGTNGKTTTSWILEAILVEAGNRVGIVGTTGNRIAGVELETVYTTPPAPIWQRLLSDMLTAGCDSVVAEVSSIALSTKRVAATQFSVGVFTNLSRDHLDFHGTFESYIESKSLLFSDLVKSNGHVVYNGLDPYAQAIVGQRSDLNYWSFGIEVGDISPTTLMMDADGVRGEISTPNGDVRLSSSLVGRHNVENSLAAIGAALALGVDIPAIEAGLSSLPGVPGRVERVDNEMGISIFVDYAHTPDAILSVGGVLRELTNGRLILVFGCGGDRDAGKRPEMARSACAVAELVIATTDNPRSESPEAILDQVRVGLNADALIIVDRREAIETAIRSANKGDVVLIAGKGHETTQEVEGVRHHFDDREVARLVLKEFVI